MRTFLQSWQQFSGKGFIYGGDSATWHLDGRLALSHFVLPS